MKETIEILNPWWFGEKDSDLEKWRVQRIRWFPEWLRGLSLRPFSLNFLVGPRQVGKTTGIKLLIRSLIEKGVEPEKIIYLNAELSPSLERFQETLLSISKGGFSLIFIDEVTSLEGWWKPLKGLIDSGAFGKSSVTVSGSMSLKLKRQAELFPGRTGWGRMVEVMPLSFSRLIKVLNMGRKSSEIKKAFETYSRLGGFPASLNHHEKFYSDWVKALESDILKTGLSLKTSYQLFSSLLTKLPSPVSYQAVASDIGVSYKTVAEYLERFEDLFVLKLVYWRENGKISFRKEKKILFRDPFILHVLSFWTRERFLEAALYENIVQEHLLRRFGEIYYYRNAFEIDCIAGDLKVEVKAGKPHRKYPRNVIILGKEDLPEFLLKLEKKVE